MGEEGQIPDWVKIVAPMLTGGLIGAILTAVVTGFRNRVQPVTRHLTVSYVDLPAIMQGYTSVITLSGHTGTGGQSQAHHFRQLAIIQLDLMNSGNKDMEQFDIGINMPEESQAIGVQQGTPDRYHTVSVNPTVNINIPSNQIDFVLKPFNRKDRYSITLVVNSTDKELYGKIVLSKRQSVRFIDPIETYRTWLSVMLDIADAIAVFRGPVRIVRKNLKDF